MKRKTLVLFPDTFLWFNEKQGVFYNCNSSSILRFNVTPTLFPYCEKISEIHNMYKIAIGNNEEVLCWIQEIVNTHMGVVCDGSEAEHMFTLPPLLNLQHEIEERNMDFANYRSLNIASHFLEATFYLGGEVLSKEKDEYYKQIPYPISCKSRLEANTLCSFIEENNFNYVRQINIISNFPSRYPHYETLLRKMIGYAPFVTFYLQGDDYEFIDKVLLYAPSESVSLGIYFENRQSLIATEALLKGKGISYFWIFIIQNETEMIEVENIIAYHQINDCKILPVFKKDMSNLNFFRDNVFISIDDLTQMVQSKRNIFCNQTLNSNFWGHLQITPDKRIYANLNANPLGTIEDNVLSVIRKEMVSKNSHWRLIRKYKEPCDTCLFKDLCPPPSNYELYLDRYDMCRILPKSSKE